LFFGTFGGIIGGTTGPLYGTNTEAPIIGIEGGGHVLPVGTIIKLLLL